MNLRDLNLQYLYYALYIFCLPLLLFSTNFLFPLEIPSNSNVPTCYNIPARQYLPIQTYSNQDPEFRQILIQTTKKSFSNYIKYCLGHDELRPSSKNCLNSYGISATLIESLETLFILNMTQEYEFSRDFILNNFSLPEIVDHHEFFSRGIASLIGTYQLTGDKRFLIKAVQMTDKILLKTTSNSNLFVEKNLSLPLSEWLAGIPELIVLNEFFHKPVYQDLIKHAISDKSSNYSIQKNKKDALIYNSFMTSFIRNSLIIGELLKENDISRPLLNRKMLKKLDMGKESKKLIKSFEKSMPDAIIDLTFASQLMPVVKEMPQSLIDHIDDVTRFGDKAHMTGFHFSGDELLALALRGKFDIVKKTILTSLETYSYGDGFSGTTTTSYGDFRPNDIQHTEFLGEWLKVGALISTGYASILNRAIFNEFGHILKIREK